MVLVFEINHPAQAHLFKHVIIKLQLDGHKVTTLIKNSLLVQEILSSHGISFINLGAKGSGFFGKGVRQIGFLQKIRELHSQSRFDIGVGVSVSLALLSKLSNTYSVILDDDDKSATPLFAAIAHSCANTLLRPATLSHEGTKQKTIHYNGYHELAYLHPSIFTPDKTVLEKQGLSGSESFFLIRSVAFRAHHDKGIRGIPEAQMKQIIKILRPQGRIIFTNETGGACPEGTERIKMHPAKIHDLMAFARLVVSDGQTMCSEASCLGVPSVRINDFAGRISYLEEQEKKWLLSFGYNPDNFLVALEKIKELLSTPKDVFIARRDRMVADSINFSSFLVWFISNYPESHRIMKQNPDYQFNFR